MCGYESHQYFIKCDNFERIYFSKMELQGYVFVFHWLLGVEAEISETSMNNESDALLDRTIFESQRNCRFMKKALHLDPQSAHIYDT